MKEVVVICSLIACFSLILESLDTLSILFSAAAVTVKKKCAVLNLQNGSSEGGADSSGRGSDSGCECLVQLMQERMIDS